MLMFKTLWQEHPYNKDGERAPCRNAKGDPSFDNQCAIRIGIALERAGMSLRTFTGARCWFKHRNHLLRTEQMVKWLNAQHAEVGVKGTAHRKVTHGDFAGQTGIAACLNFWGSGNRGDHIDLWDGTVMPTGAPDYFDRAEVVWFWEIK
jgi:hypothetical protein